MAHIGQEGRLGVVRRFRLLLRQQELGVYLLQVDALARQLGRGFDKRLVLDRKVLVGLFEVGGVVVDLDLIADPV